MAAKKHALSQDVIDHILWREEVPPKDAAKRDAAEIVRKFEEIMRPKSSEGAPVPRRRPK